MTGACHARPGRATQRPARQRPDPSPDPGPLVLWHSVSLLSALSAIPDQVLEAIMTEQAVMEATAATVAEQDDRDLAAEDEALVAEELLVEEVSIDGMCGVY
jgi:mycofactocin precursor